MSGPGNVWMPLYVADWNDKTRHLDCEQDGAYGRLIRHYWKNGPLPDDDAQLARIVGMERVRWKKSRPALAPFFEIRAGYWFNKRADEELRRAGEIIEKRRLAGLQGGRPKKHMVLPGESKPKANEKQTGKQNETHARVALPSPSPLPPEGSEDKSSDADGVVFDIGKECWRAAVQLLRERDGLSEAGARKFFGALLAEHGLAARDMYPPVASVATNGTEGARAYLTKAAQRIAKERGQPKLSAHDRYVRSNII